MTLPIRSIVLTFLLLTAVANSAQGKDESALALFKKRITPILSSPMASSCTECHLSGVDLKNYIGDTQEETFASLRSAGLINMNEPDKSKLLQFIHRTPEKRTPIGKEVRKQEYEAFRAWIRAAVKDPKLAAAKTANDQLGQTVPVEVVRHTRKSRVLQSFTENLWSEMGRCVNCHSPELNRQKIGRNGFTKEDVDAISWVVPRDPAATLEKLVETGNIDLDDPEESQVLTKPAGLEEHGGGPKFAVGSRTDKNFRRFLNDYASIINGKYNDATQLPEPSSQIAVMTNQQLRIVDLPPRFDKKLLRADIYRRLGDSWSKTPWATAENPIAGKKYMWQSMVTAIAPRGSSRAKELTPQQPIPDGRYLIKIYIDREDKTKKDRDYELGHAEFYGQVEVHGEWKPGYQPPKIIRAPKQD